MNTNRKLLAVIIVTVYLLLDICGSALATEYQNQGGSTVNCLEECSSFLIPEIIDREEQIENGYVRRLKEDEQDLYTFVFLNGDGSNTMRVFSHPVKYLDNNGFTRDISLVIEQNETGSYSAADHMINVDFGSELSAGINLEYSDTKVIMNALTEDDSISYANLSDDGKRISYSINDKTEYVYSLTYTGIKEEIIVSEYTGQTEYEFVLHTFGLHPERVDDSVFLADEDGKIKLFIGDVIVFTADEKNNGFGDLFFESIIENNEYKFTVVLDEDFLQDEKTAYPIVIDPTLEVNYTNNGAGAIEDVTINNNTTFSGTSGSLHVGRHSTGSISRILMRFPNLDMPVNFGPLILSAKVEIRDLMCQSDEDFTVYCYSYKDSAPTWSESGTTTWSSVGSSYIGDLQSSHLISYGQGNVSSQRYGFTITSLAKLWADGVSSPSKGIVFKASNTFETQTSNSGQYWHKTFSSYNRTSYRPSLTIKYEKQAVFTIKNEANGSRYLTASASGADGATFSSSINSLSGTQMWCIEYLSEYNAVNIVSMGLRYSGGKLAYVVYNNTTLTGLASQQKSSTYKQYQPIRYSNGCYYFKNKSNSRYLSISSSYTILTNSSTQDSKSRFVVSKLATSNFNNFWSGGYSAGIYNGVAYIKIKLDQSILSHSVYSGNDFSAALWWNGLSNNVKIYGPNDSVPSGITPIIVTFATDSSLSVTTFGATIPNGKTNSELQALTSSQIATLYTSNWNKITIYLNGKTGSSNPFVMFFPDETDRLVQLNKVICHEMGHALKLAHPMESNNDGIRHTFTGSRGNYSGNESVYAIMNQGSFNGTNGYLLTASKPQDHDIINLISKWEYHINCNH